MSVVTAAWAAPGMSVRATFGAHVAVDEPQYLLSATSLVEDGDLDISDELREQRWRTYHEANLPEQTRPLAGGQRLSPHDPLLPAVLAVPMGLGGWVAAKLAMAAMAGALAALMVWVAVRRLAVPLGWSVVGVLAFTLSPPLSVYGTQVYPELPAALAVTAGFASATARPGARLAAGVAAAAVVLPWLSVKYAPVAATLAAVALWRMRAPEHRRTAAAMVGTLAVAGIVHAGMHQAIYGGFTPYAAGDHFVDGELTVVSGSPDLWGRGRRLLGLLVDRDFGLVPWQPLWLAAVPALAALARRRPPWALAAGVPAAAGWLTATFLALTMHGFWWPGRQTVVVLPLVALVVVWWLATVVPVRGRAVLSAGLVAGAVTFAWLVAEGAARDLTWVVDFWTTGNPLHRMWRPLLPDLRSLTAGDELRYWLWLLAAAGLAAGGWRSAAGGGGGGRSDEDAVGREHADAHGAVVDAHGHRAIG